MIKKLLLFIFISVAVNCNAQNAKDIIKIEGVSQGGLKFFESVINKETNEVYGHFICYRKDNKLRIDFLDTDLNVDTKFKIRLPLGFNVSEALIYDDLLLFVAREPYGHIAAYTYTLDGKKIGKTSLRGSSEISYFLTTDNSDNYYTILPARTGKKRYGYTVQKLNKKLKVVWRKRFLPEKKGSFNIEAAAADNDKLVMAQVYQPKLISRKVSSHLFCIDSKGDTVFFQSLKNGNTTIIPSKMIFDKQNNIVTVGQFYKGNKQRNNKSKGIFIQKTSNTGGTIAMNKYEWRDGIQQNIKKSQIAIGGKSHIFFHDLIQNRNGTFQLIGETYSTSKTGACLGLLNWFENYELLHALAVMQNHKALLESIISGRYIGNVDINRSASTITTQDMAIFDFGTDCSLTQVKRVEKDYSKIYAYRPFTFMGGLQLSKHIAYKGFFDYSFTTNENIVVYNSAYSRYPHIGAFVANESSKNTPVKIIPFKELDDGNGNTGKRNMGKRGLAGVAPSINGKVVVYYYMDDEKPEEEDEGPDEQKKRTKKRRKKLIKKVQFICTMKILLVVAKQTRH